MSLEAGIAELNTNIRALIAALAVRDPIPDASSTNPAPAPKPTPAASATTEPAADSKPTAEAPPAAAPESKALAYDADVAPAILALVKAKGREAATTLLGEFGAKRGTDLKPEQFASFVAKAKRLMS